MLWLLFLVSMVSDEKSTIIGIILSVLSAIRIFFSLCGVPKSLTIMYLNTNFFKFIFLGFTQVLELKHFYDGYFKTLVR